MHRLTILFEKNRRNNTVSKNTNVILLVCDDTVVGRNSFKNGLTKKTDNWFVTTNVLNPRTAGHFFGLFFSYAFKDLLMVIKNVWLFPTKSCCCLDLLLALVLFRFMNEQGDEYTKKNQLNFCKLYLLQVKANYVFNIIFYSKLLVLVVEKNPQGFRAYVTYWQALKRRKKYHYFKETSSMTENSIYFTK